MADKVTVHLAFTPDEETEVNLNQAYHWAKGGLLVNGENTSIIEQWKAANAPQEPEAKDATPTDKQAGSAPAGTNPVTTDQNTSKESN